jgi:AraC family transcriptional activator of pobA
VHVETIRSRSEPRDWTIGEHTHGGLAQLIVVLTGGVRATLDEQREHQLAPVALAVPSGAVHGFRFDTDTDGLVVSIGDVRLDTGAMGPWIRTVLFERGAVIPLVLDAARQVEAVGRCLLSEYEAVAVGSDVAVDALLQALLVAVARAAEAQGGAAGAARQPDLYRTFRDAVEAHYLDHWSVARYASELGVSESTLNRVVRRVTGGSAFELTQERLELEARRRLRFSGTPVHQLASELGFVDASYFARFVRRRTGRTPSDHRNG